MIIRSNPRPEAVIRLDQLQRLIAEHDHGRLTRDELEKAFGLPYDQLRDLARSQP